jgi:hypothetical protein
VRYFAIVKPAYHSHKFGVPFYYSNICYRNRYEKHFWIY